MILVILAVAAVAKQVVVGAIIAAGLGVMLVLWGLKSRREAGVVSQIPEAPIGSISAGLVHIHGRTAGDERLISPISGASCFYYKLQVDKKVKRGDQESWEAFKNETGQRRLYLEDGTGRVSVDLQEAEFDLPQTLRAEIGPSSMHYCHVDPALGIGMLTENQLHAALVSDWGQARAAVQRLGSSGVVKAADAVLAAGQTMAEWGVSANVDGVQINPGMVGESFRIQETCLLADREYSVIGTCDQNPDATNDQDRRVVHKGKAEKTFLVSVKTGDQLAKGLRVRATVMMVAGVLLIVGAAAWAFVAK